MRYHPRAGRLAWLAIALAAGAMLGRLWPETPLHATASDSSSVCVIATGAMDLGIEAIFVLDTITGDLKAGVLSRRNGMFRAQYERNITADFEMADGKKHQFLMVTGVTDLIRPPGGNRVGMAVAYVADTTSGVIRAYGVPWIAQLHVQDQPLPHGKLVPLGIWKYRGKLIRQDQP